MQGEIWLNACVFDVAQRLCKRSIFPLSRYTGKERDTESGNDYFGARYYASTIGRWMSPDWSAKVEPVPYSKLDDPQTLNLYSYGMNNPLIRIDLDGHAPLSWGGFESCGSEYAAIGCGAGSQTAAYMAQKSAFDAQQAARQQNASDKPSFSITASNGNLELTNANTGHTVGDYSYVSGMNGDTNPVDKGKGPIPPGRYTLDPKEISSHWWRKLFMSDWGDYRAPLHPEAGTDTHGRSGFFLHGGGVHWQETRYGSEGCIKVWDLNQNHLFELLQGAKGPVEVTVR